MSAGFPAPQRGTAYQPRATPWVSGSTHSRVLKERRISSDRQHTHNPALCRVPSERIRRESAFPGLHPGLVCFAPLGHPCPVGA